MAKKPTLGGLTGIRFFAAIYVVLFHYLDVEKYNVPLASQIVHYGYVGVSLFFVLSGFVLAYNYPKFETVGDRNHFWWARFARIYPLYFVALILSLPIFFSYTDLGSLLLSTKAILKVGLETSLLNAWTPWTSCGVNCPGWSLSAEAFFYLVFPLIIPVIGRLSGQRLKALMVLLWVGALIFPVGFILFGARFGTDTPLYILVRDMVRFTPLLHLPQFLIGAATGILFGRERASNSQNSGRLWILGLVALAVIFIVLATLNLDYALVNNGLFAPLFALIIWILARGRGRVTRILSSRPLVLLGEASYAVYILQYPLAGWFSRLRTGAWITARLSLGTLFIYLILLVGISVGSYLLFESPVRRKIMKFVHLAEKRRLISDEIRSL